MSRRMSNSSYQEQSRGFVEKLREEYLVTIDQKQLDFILDVYKFAPTWPPGHQEPRSMNHVPNCPAVTPSPDRSAQSQV